MFESNNKDCSGNWWNYVLRFQSENSKVQTYGSVTYTLRATYTYACDCACICGCVSVHVLQCLGATLLCLFNIRWWGARFLTVCTNHSIKYNSNRARNRRIYTKLCILRQISFALHSILQFLCAVIVNTCLASMCIHVTDCSHTKYRARRNFAILFESNHAHSYILYRLDVCT